MTEDLKELLKNTETPIQKNITYTKDIVSSIRNGEIVTSSFPNRKQRRAEQKKKK